ncbi:MAG: PIN domain-containing protein [Bacteroidales bacterium]|nr:PIN domain-containing protein [Bacteroidales bacterium]
MKKVFLDTNILLDAIQKRQNCQFAETIILLGKKAMLELCVSVISYPTIAYVLRKQPKPEIYRLLNTFSDSMTILPTNSQMFKAAITAQADDFEDMLQYQTAISYNCDALITNNIKDFIEFAENIKIQTAKEFLVEFDNEDDGSL